MTPLIVEHDQGRIVLQLHDGACCVLCGVPITVEAFVLETVAAFGRPTAPVWCCTQHVRDPTGADYAAAIDALLEALAATGDLHQGESDA